jgi:hypothetical protein
MAHRTFLGATPRPDVTVVALGGPAPSLFGLRPFPYAMAAPIWLRRGRPECVQGKHQRAVVESES